MPPTSRPCCTKNGAVANFLPRLPYARDDANSSMTSSSTRIDRLMHHGEALVIQGESYRMKDKPSDPT